MLSESSSESQRHRRHRHRRWYKRLWRALFPPSQPKRVYVAIALVMIILSILLGVVVARMAASSQVY
jgi:hypothetical protein